MAEKRDFGRDLERIGDGLAAGRDALETAAALLSDTARTLVLPDEAELATERARLKDLASKRQANEAALARLVAGFSAEVGSGKAAFDNRETPTRLERLIGRLSNAAMRRRMEARWKSPATLDRLEALLRRADLLLGLARHERTAALLQRKESEGHLIALADRRQEIVEGLREKPSPGMTLVEATSRIERFVAVFQELVNLLNASVGSYNILIHKLEADTEDLLILYKVVSEPLRARRDEGLELAGFPNLAAGLERFSSGMLTLDGLDKRRARADHAFAERFSSDAAGQTSTGARQGDGGFRLPTLSP